MKPPLRTHAGGHPSGDRSTSHTPGPWTVRKSALTWWQVLSDRGVELAAPDREADAHLIAAAPKMLEMLCRALAALEAYAPQSKAIDEIEAVIAEARGKVEG